MPTFHYVPMTIQKLNYLMNRNNINTDPEYQRDIVWKSKNQQELIHTLLDGFPMPALNFCEDNDPCLPKYECMDGKNRLHSIRLFMTNQLQTKDGGYFKDLSEDERQDFESIEVSVCIFTNLSPSQRQDYFRRIQNGVVLNQCEMIWSQADHPLMIEIRRMRSELLDKLKVIWSTKRYTDIQLIFNIANMINGKNPTLQSTGLTDWLSRQSKTADYKDTARAIRVVILVLHSVMSACPQLHQKLKVPFTLDLANWIISNNCRKPSVNVIKNFSNDIGKLITQSDEDVEHQYSKDYFSILKNGAASHQYSNRIALTRFQIVSAMFM
jgi:hypothetical protein